MNYRCPKWRVCSSYNGKGICVIKGFPCTIDSPKKQSPVSAFKKRLIKRLKREYGYWKDLRYIIGEIKKSR